MIFCTVAANNYLAEAVFLARRIREIYPTAKIALAQPERRSKMLGLQRPEFDCVMSVEDLGYENSDVFAFLHDITELSTAIKARFFQKLFYLYGDENSLIYLDPDIWIFSALDEVQNEFLAGNTILLTPHHLDDEDDYEGIKDNVFRTLKCGIFNLGFLALARGAIADRFLEWWTNKLDILCYIDFERGLFVDQKWIDLAPCFFPTRLLPYRGYNVANWNVSKRRVWKSREAYFVNDEPLRFFHFSGLRMGKDLKFFRKYAPDPLAAVHELRRLYRENISRVNAEFSFESTGWSYGQYLSGEAIPDDIRRYVRRYPELLASVPNPFALSNEEWLSRF